jgi:hypothetical protein
MTNFDEIVAAVVAEQAERDALRSNVVEIQASLEGAINSLAVLRTELEAKDTLLADARAQLEVVEAAFEAFKADDTTEDAAFQAEIARLQAIIDDLTEEPEPEPVGILIGTSGENSQDQRPLEAAIGSPLGVRRQYYDISTASKISSSVTSVRADILAGRKPHPTWKLMSNGYGWTWQQVVDRDPAALAALRSLLTQLQNMMNGLDPAIKDDVEILFGIHHEPEGDYGNNPTAHALWARMQEVVAELVSERNDPRISLWFVVQGWPQIFDGTRVSRGTTWENILPKPENLPDNVSYGIGIDPYNWFSGPNNDGSKGWSEMDGYFQQTAAEANRRGWRWGVSESAFTDVAFADARGAQYLARTFASLEQYGGEFFAYFNTVVSGEYSWRLGSGAKQQAYVNQMARLGSRPW